MTGALEREGAQFWADQLALLTGDRLSSNIITGPQIFDRKPPLMHPQCQP